MYPSRPGGVGVERAALRMDPAAACGSLGADVVGVVKKARGSLGTKDGKIYRKRIG